MPATGNRTTITSATLGADRRAHHARAGRPSPLPVVAAAVAATVAPAVGTAEGEAARRSRGALRVKPPRERRRQAGEAAAASTSRAAEAAEPAAACRRRRRWPSKRRWRLRHVVAVMSAPLVLIAGGGFAYAWLSRRADRRGPECRAPDVFTAAATLQKAGFEVDSVVTDNPRPGGVVLAPDPRRRAQGSTRARPSRSPISDIVATVP